MDEAKKYYPLFGLMANVALIFSGQYVKYVSSLRKTLAPGADPWGQSLNYLMGAVLGGGALVMGIMGYMQVEILLYVILFQLFTTQAFLYLQTNVLTDPACVDPNKEAKRKKSKVSDSLISTGHVSLIMSVFMSRRK